MEISRVNLASSPGGQTPQAGEHSVTGYRNGMALAQVAPGTAPSISAAAPTRADAGSVKKPAANYKVGVEGQFRAMRGAAIMAAAETALGKGAGQEVRLMARDILRGKVTSPGGAFSTARPRVASTARYLALQLAAQCLEDGETDSTMTARLTPIRRREQDPASPQQELIDYIDDPEEIAHALEGAGVETDDAKDALEEAVGEEGLSPKELEELYEKYMAVRFEPEKLMALLRNQQGLRSVTDLRRELREKIHEEIREIECSPHGALVLGSLNAASAASKTVDAVGFLDAYTDLVKEARGFWDTVKFLAGPRSLEALDSTVDSLKKALGDDLAAALPSRDTAWLSAILERLGHMHIMTTLKESCGRLKVQVDRSAQVDRSTHAAPAA